MFFIFIILVFTLILENSVTVNKQIMLKNVSCYSSFFVNYVDKMEMIHKNEEF